MAVYTKDNLQIKIYSRDSSNDEDYLWYEPSDDNIPTQKAVKTYVDVKVGTVCKELTFDTTLYSQTQQYEAPSDGWFVLTSDNKNCTISLSNITLANFIVRSTYTNNDSTGHSIILPVNSGNIVEAKIHKAYNYNNAAKLYFFSRR